MIRRKTFQTVLILLGFSFFLNSCGHSPADKGNLPAQDSIQSNLSIQVTLDAKGFIPNDTAELAFSEGGILTDAITKSKEIQFELKSYDGLGHLVTGINGLKNEDQAGHFWQCCIDGTYSDKGIDEIKPVVGMKLSWFYRAYGECPCKKIGEK